MWECGNLAFFSEISKLLWKSFFDFHQERHFHSRAIFCSHLLSPRNRGIADPGRRADRRSWGILRGRFVDASSSRPISSPFSHAIALPLRRDHGRMMGEAIEQRGREFFVAGEDGHPFCKRKVECSAYCYAELTDDTLANPSFFPEDQRIV